MKIYTKTGDLGDTGLFGGPRVRKDNLRIEAYGTVDELNAVLGLARLAFTDQPVNPILQEIESLLGNIQHSLFDLGAELATPDPKSRGTNFISPAQITALESAIDRFDAKLPALKTFVLPGGTTAAAWLHLARTVCRRAERRVVTLMDQDATVGNRQEPNLSPHVLVYLNRLSDLLFVLARAANQAAGQVDIEWQKPTNGK